MNWILKTLVGAMVAGIGWKIGSEVYETVKETIKGQSSKKENENEEEQEKEKTDEADGDRARSPEVVDPSPAEPAAR